MRSRLDVHDDSETLEFTPFTNGSVIPFTVIVLIHPRKMPQLTSDTDSSLDFPDKDWFARARRKLLRWFDGNARDLPWRIAPTPYRVWVSEIMLQQTQVVTVIPYFERFMASLPDVRALAEADEATVLRHWEGLGYYRRARQLHAAAQVVMDKHGGEFPVEFEDVLALPGIGRYTAGAILSIALDKPFPILEANTIRVYSRLLRFEGNPLDAAGQRLLWRFAETILPRKNSRAINQSLMELGSQICSPQSPDCLNCPLHHLCPTREAGLQEQIPAPKKKTKYESITEHAIAIHHNQRVLLRLCQPDERWAGLWDFVRVAIPDSASHDDNERLIVAVRDCTGLTIDGPQPVTTIKHGVTRFRITLRCYQASKVGGRLKTGAHCKWMRLSELPALPLSTTGRKLANLLSN